MGQDSASKEGLHFGPTNAGTADESPSDSKSAPKASVDTENRPLMDT